MLDSVIPLVIMQTKTKIDKSVLNDEDRQSLQDDLHRISAWSDIWEMPINIDKCQALQVEIRSKRFDDEMRRQIQVRSVRYRPGCQNRVKPQILTAMH